MLLAPKSGGALIDPDAWWMERRSLSRELLDQGDAGPPTELASAHAAESPSNQADAEFHAGWYALRGSTSQLPPRGISPASPRRRRRRSRSRGHITGSAAPRKPAAGEQRPLSTKSAATYGTTFYGQFAAGKLGRHRLRVEDPTPSAADRSAFYSRDAVQAIARLEAAGHGRRRPLYRDLAAELTSPGELALLAGMAERRGDHFLALQVARQPPSAASTSERWRIRSAPSPRPQNFPARRARLPMRSRARKASSTPAPCQPAGARGLLQLMPGTAKEVGASGRPAPTRRSG